MTTQIFHSAVWLFVLFSTGVYPGVVPYGLAKYCARIVQDFGRKELKLPFPIPEDSKSLPETAVIETTQGSFEISFYREVAPITVRNFEYLGKKGFYNNLTFHKYEPDFAIHGGDPKGTGRGGPGYALPPENSSITNERGTIGMLRFSDIVDPERRSNGSQFYISLTRSKHLDGRFTIFARVIDGMENVEKLREGDKILHILFPRR